MMGSGTVFFFFQVNLEAAGDTVNHCLSKHSSSDCKQPAEDVMNGKNLRLIMAVFTSPVSRR